jgi:MFS family permease
MIERGKGLAQRVREKSVLAEIKEGFHYIFTHRDIRLVITTMFGLFAIVGAVYVVVVVFIQESFQSVTKDLGVLVFCLVVGLFLGVVVYGRVGKKFLWYQTIFFCLMLGGVFLAAFALGIHYWQNLICAMVTAILLGISIGPIFVAANTVLHIVSDETMRGKVFSALEIIIHAAFLLTMFASSWASQYVPKVWILAFAGGVCVVMGAVGFLRGKLALRE